MESDPTLAPRDKSAAPEAHRKVQPATPHRAGVALSAHTHTHGVLDERGGQRNHAASPQHSLNNNKFG